MEKDNANTTHSTVKVVVIGPESTGKSTLSEALSQHYNAPWVPEYARYYIDQLERSYDKHDLLEIARGQIQWEEQKTKEASHLLICDTDLIVIKVWAEHKYDDCHSEILETIHSRHYDLYLLTDVDLPWEEDPQRENPHLREYFMGVFKTEIEKTNTPYTIISGNYEQRMQTAVEAIDSLINK